MSLSAEQIEARFGLPLPAQHKPRYNIAPTQEILTLLSDKQGRRVETCTIITTEPNDLIKPIHNRMPVIVPQELEEFWLDPSPRARAELECVLRPYRAEEMELFEVSAAVNSPSTDGPECIAPVIIARERDPA